MTSIGTWNSLTILRDTPHGRILYGGEHGDILLPKKYQVNKDVGEKIRVFVYYDSEDRIIATTLPSTITRNEFGYLPCVTVNRFGAFMDIGLDKHLLVPFAEQVVPLTVGRSYITYLFVDSKSSRLVGSTKTNKWLQKGEFRFLESQEVDIIISEETTIGWKAIINHMDLGLIYKSQVFQPLSVGKKLKAYISLVREDGRIDLTLQAPLEELNKQLTSCILQKLEKSGGILKFSDKSSSTEIAEHFLCSKKAFKKALGALYKQRRVEIVDDHIKLVQA
jgi:uncharacterized protein